MKTIAPELTPPAGNSALVPAGSDTPAFYVQPVAPGRYSYPGGGDGDLVHPLTVIEHAATLASDDEARTLVRNQAEAVFAATRRGRLIAATHHRDHTRLALAAGYRVASLLDATLKRCREWIIIPGGDQPRTGSVRLQVGFFTVIGLLAMVADVLLIHQMLKDTVAPDSPASDLLLKIAAVAILPVLGFGLAKGYTILRHALPEARAASERRFALACWPAVLVAVLAAAVRYLVLKFNPTTAAADGHSSLVQSDTFLIVVFCLQLGAQVVASTAAFACVLRLLQETRESFCRLDPDFAAPHAKLQAETAKVQENLDTLGWSEARVGALEGERAVFMNECLADLAAKRDARQAVLLRIGLLERSSRAASRIPASRN